MTIADKRILFAHQSVGCNILAGITALPQAGLGLKIAETRSPDSHPGPGLIHTAVGTNQDPVSKIRDFVSLMNSGFGNNVDIAGFKFCYIDINRGTDVESLFTQYHTAMEQLAEQYKQTRFLHITVPLRTVEPPGRLLLKRLLGKKSILLEDNWKRQQFNEMMRSAYKDKQPLFDLAKAESTAPSGKRYSSSLNGNSVYSLAPEYTSDGGHLNKEGQKIIAKQFLDYLQQINQHHN